MLVHQVIIKKNRRFFQFFFFFQGGRLMSQFASESDIMIYFVCLCLNDIKAHFVSASLL